jgi:hypothetical protein
MTDQVDNTTQETPINNINQEVETEQSTSFIDQISDPELKGWAEKAGYKDLNGLAKSAMHLEKKLGSPKESENYDAEQYTYELPENYNANENLLNPIKDKAIELGIAPDKFKALVETFTGKESELMQQMQADKETQVKQLQETLKKEWGNAYDDNLKLADKTWQSLAGEGEDKMLENMAPEQQLAIAKIMANVGSKISEQSLGKPTIDPISAKSEMDSIYSDMKHPYWDNSHPDHAQAVKKMQELASKV